MPPPKKGLFRRRCAGAPEPDSEVEIESEI
jgi:hypothetical protein